MIKKLYKLIYVFSIIALLLSVFEIEHIFCKDFFPHVNVKEHNHNICSHHCSDTFENHQKHSTANNCCDSEEPHDHPTRNPAVSFSDFSFSQQCSIVISHISLQNILNNNSENLFIQPNIEQSQTNYIKTVVLLI